MGMAGKWSPSGRPDRNVSRAQFPPDFLFGATSSSYQYEGGTWDDGRRPSIWDAFTHAYPERILDRSSGDVATDSYHLYKDDISLVKNLGMNAYRFSVSWSRILPYGKLSRGINQKGIHYYNSVINETLSQGLTPFMTLLHLDYPQALQDEYGGVLSHRFVDDFRDFADLCFKEFGDRIKHWVAINEPHTLSRGGFAVGDLAPGRCSGNARNWTCDVGNSGTEPYIAAHNQLLAHAAAVQLFMDPITKGDYPESMKQNLGNRLPRFTNEESELLKGSFDFLGVNYYTGRYAMDQPNSNVDPRQSSYLTDALINTSYRNSKGEPLGPETAAPWVRIYPAGLTKVLLYIKNKYGNPLVYITENGVPDLGNYTHSPLKATPNDNIRVSFYQAHLSSVLKAMRKGANVKGYMVWALLDNFEWLTGYTIKFGLYYVDVRNPSVRIPKLSALWFRKFLKGNDRRRLRMIEVDAN
ncbi:unnamed protein product [Linum tenue]|uniref:Uncharacterized protein n=1 Tax=Linum tenue TaxID=586396 RepID=A0AAV0GSZ0_9ROSI|nr:unnamed protein product [Linum tenue]